MGFEWAFMKFLLRLLCALFLIFRSLWGRGFKEKVFNCICGVFQCSYTQLFFFFFDRARAKLGNGKTKCCSISVHGGYL